MSLDFDDLIIPEMPEPRAAQPAPSPRDSSEAACLAIMGASGGAGVTSVAIETGYAAMKLLRAGGNTAPRVCLLDLDFECGALASYLDIEAGLRPDVLAGDPSRIDPALTSAMIVKHGSGLRLLAAAGQLGGNAKVNPDCVLALMDAASTMYDVLVLDVPRLWRPWTQAALAAADRAIMLTELTIPGLYKTRLRLENIEAEISLSAPLDIVLSKYERRSFRAAISLKDAQAALGRDILASICVDAETPRDAMNCGEPSGSVHPDSRFSKDVAAMTALLLSAAEPEAMPQPRRRRRAAR